jgi:hypothetical protein
LAVAIEHLLNRVRSDHSDSVLFGNCIESALVA